MKIDELLEKECYVIDFLPMRVPKDSSGYFFEVENYLLNYFERYGLREKYIMIILKIMCYYRISVSWGVWIDNPAPEQIADIIDTIMENHSGWVDIVIPDKQVLIQFEWDCLHMTVYNPDEELCRLFELIALSEGMFWKKGE